jgi:hypothetical protein
MTRTTPPRGVDVEALFPELAPYPRAATAPASHTPIAPTRRETVPLSIRPSRRRLIGGGSSGSDPGHGLPTVHVDAHADFQHPQ